MIIVNLKGGLGNQMFQYALGRALAEKNNDILKLDIAALTEAATIGNIPRAYGLQHFKIKAYIATNDEVAAIRPIPSLAPALFRKVRTRLFGDPTVQFDPTVLQMTGNVYLDGYWQSPRYFEAIRDTLLSELTLKESLTEDAATIATKITATQAVSLHVRRGDYVKNSRVNKEFGVCSIAYYQNAIAKIREQVTDPTFFIFSDDMAWVKENLPVGEEAVYVQGEKLIDAVELVLMSQCQHNIIANSSFSWWGAWLNQNPGKIIIAPTPWFDNAIYDKDLIPKSWIQLPK